ncbi:MAG: hypothetical protein EOO60_13735 [Hymenobacter sp.]|nr:MAG: hypothetical protein EOO60_13735 [Hymenobacter sp.]
MYYGFYTITAKQIGALQGVSYKTACKEFHRVRAALALPHDRRLVLRDLAQAWKTTVADLAAELYRLSPPR